MLEELLRHLRNWFVNDIYNGHFVIEGGSIDLPFIAENQYYRIIGSVFNDGLHKKYGSTETLTDEEFDGAVWALAVPKAVVDLSEEIATWITAHPASDYQSESFGGYSYTKGTGKSGRASTWHDVFASRLNAWRKI